MWNSKPKKAGHNCSKRHFGKPKVGRGLCHRGVRQAVKDRIVGKRVAHKWLRAVDREDLDL